MEVRPGYKQTEVGVIPEDWDVTPLGNYVRITSGESPSLIQFTASGKPYFKVEQLGNREKYMGGDSTPYHFLNGKTVPRNSVIFAKRGAAISLNRVRILSEDSFMDTNLMALTCLGELDHEFLYYGLGHIGLWQFADTTSVPQINNKHVKPLCFPIPTLAEQRAIAAALSDVDALLGGLERLIAKKRDLKQAAMQQLLTGQTRLPGFSGAWEVKRLDELADIRSGGTPSTTVSQFWDGDIPWCTPTDITALKGQKFLSDTNRMITPQGLKASSAEMIPSHSIVMTSRATIGECAINMVPVSTNQGFKNFIPFATTDVDFLYYLLTTQKQGFINLCGGSTFLEIGKTQLIAYQVRLPGTKAEQTAIAAVLSDMDAELSLLTARRDKTRDLKQAMMQELLTGRTRLI